MEENLVLSDSALSPLSGFQLSHSRCATQNQDLGAGAGSREAKLSHCINEGEDREVARDDFA